MDRGYGQRTKSEPNAEKDYSSDEVYTDTSGADLVWRDNTRIMTDEHTNTHKITGKIVTLKLKMSKVNFSSTHIASCRFTSLDPYFSVQEHRVWAREDWADKELGQAVSQ